MSAYIANITPRDGIARRVALIAFDLADARRETMLLARAMFGTGFRFSVWRDYR